MNEQILNICQVSLARDIEIIKENYDNFNLYYKNLRFHIICPKKEIETFKKELNKKNINIYEEDSILALEEFHNIFISLASNISYKNQFNERLKWYYQQILKISFVCEFIKNRKENMVIWDADTVLLKKINFFKSKNFSEIYGNIFEFHKAYFVTVKDILNHLPNYFVSSLNQFISITVDEWLFLEKIFNLKILKKESKSSVWISKIILSSIFLKHNNYNGSLFSEYELIGLSKLIKSAKKQKIILFLRAGLDGKLTRSQISICKIFNFLHVTYEHSHLNSNSIGMLNRNQNWLNFVKILIKNLFKFYLRKFRYEFLYYIKK